MTETDAEQTGSVDFPTVDVPDDVSEGTSSSRGSKFGSEVFSESEKSADMRPTETGQSGPGVVSTMRALQTELKMVHSKIDVLDAFIRAELSRSREISRMSSDDYKPKRMHSQPDLHALIPTRRTSTKEKLKNAVELVKDEIKKFETKDICHGVGHSEAKNSVNVKDGDVGNGDNSGEKMRKTSTIESDGVFERRQLRLNSKTLSLQQPRPTRASQLQRHSVISERPSSMRSGSKKKDMVTFSSVNCEDGSGAVKWEQNVEIVELKQRGISEVHDSDTLSLPVPGEPVSVWQLRGQELVDAPMFDYCSAFLVLSNAATIGVNADHMARNNLEHPTIGFRVIDTTFCFLFLSELLLRIFAFRSKFFCGADVAWNIFDFLLVFVQVSDEILTHVLSAGLGINISFMRILRILRLIRIIRIVRILRLLGDLRAIVSSMLSSLQSLFWAVLLLFLVVYIFAVLMTQLALDHRLDMQAASEDDTKIQEFFGSLGSSLISLYQCISNGVSWREAVLPVMHRISVIPGIIIIFYIAFASLALLNVVTGVFVQTAMKSAENDQQGYMLHHVRELFALADPDGSGLITWDKFMECTNDWHMLEFFESINVDPSEAPGVFHLLDVDDSGEIDLDEFLHGCLGLHGPAKAIHLATLMYETRTMARFQFTRTKLLLDLLQEVALTLIGDEKIEKYKEASSNEACMSRRRTFEASMDLAKFAPPEQTMHRQHRASMAPDKSPSTDSRRLNGRPSIHGRRSEARQSVHANHMSGHSKGVAEFRRRSAESLRRKSTGLALNKVAPQ